MDFGTPNNFSTKIPQGFKLWGFFLTTKYLQSRAKELNHLFLVIFKVV